MLDRSLAESIAVLSADGKSVRAIARFLGVSRNTVRGYLRQKVQPGVQVRPNARALSPSQVERARDLWKTAAAGNSVVVVELLAAEKVEASLRSVQRAVQDLVLERKDSDAVTERFETKPGEQMQVDFGERWVLIGGHQVRVYFFVATLGYSRRLYVRASLSQRQDEWKLGIEGALEHFGGRPMEIVVDNAAALIRRHGADVVEVNPAFAAYCKDRGLHVRACRPYRPRTKGKVESGVKYVKRNAIAGRSFESFAALERHLAEWMPKADMRIHGTTHRRPIDLFNEHERRALLPLRRGLDVTGQRLRRVVANDCHVDVDTVRYSVPYQLAGKRVEVRTTADEVIIEHQAKEVARHPRSMEPHHRVSQPAHFEGIHRPRKVTSNHDTTASPPPAPSQTACWAQQRLRELAEAASGAEVA